jgi:hypothetical protein
VLAIFRYPGLDFLFQNSPAACVAIEVGRAAGHVALQKSIGQKKQPKTARG